VVGIITSGGIMGKHPRIGLLLGAAACLLAVLFDWIIVELKGNPAKKQSLPIPLPAAESATAAPYTT
jgi:hypothetical protein